MRKKSSMVIDVKLDLPLPINLPSLDIAKKAISLKKTEGFHKLKREIPRIIHSKVDKHEIIYGARALNKRFPSFLDMPTQDYDIFTPHPKQDAREVERALDKRFGGDYFFVEKARHPNTWRVKSHATGGVYADYTEPDENIPYDVIGGKKYVKLSHVKKSIHKTLDDPMASYRHEKDKDALNRIKIYEKHRR